MLGYLKKYLITLSELCSHILLGAEYKFRKKIKNADIDVKDLIRNYSTEELNKYADEYFDRPGKQGFINFLFSKPFHDLNETPGNLISFGKALQGMNALPGMTVIDFGAGSCWSTRLLVQLGLRVTAVDVSQAALDIGRRLFDEQPVFGHTFPPQFLHYDGDRIEVPNDSIDRIFCFDAFHHVPDQKATLHEMARVLKEGGKAVFVEPGSYHSVTAESQREMRDHKVIENNVVLDQVWDYAQNAGFTDMKVSIFNKTTVLVPIKEQSRFVRFGGKWAFKVAFDSMREQVYENVFATFKRQVHRIVYQRPQLVSGSRGIYEGGY